jgi:hypothetical protein
MLSLAGCRMRGCPSTLELVIASCRRTASVCGVMTSALTSASWGLCSMWVVCCGIANFHTPGFDLPVQVACYNCSA